MLFQGGATPKGTIVRTIAKPGQTIAGQAGAPGKQTIVIAAPKGGQGTQTDSLKNPGQ